MAPKALPNYQEVKKEIEECFVRIGKLTEKETYEAMQFIAIEAYDKGDLVLQKGELTAKSYSVVSGCLRQYHVFDGEEKTTFFYTEGDSIFTATNGHEKTPSKFSLACVEPTVLTVMTLEHREMLYQKFPTLEALSRIALQQQLTRYQELLATYMVTTPEERYLNVLQVRPGLLNRVPQYQLASYLGVTPESLSRIRKRISQK